MDLTDLNARFKESQDVSAFSRAAAEECIRFARLGNQWPDDIEKVRSSDRRPCLVINRLPAFIRQIVNDARMSKPAMLTRPVDNGADPRTSSVINGILRHIERASTADVAYDTAIDHAITCGFGFFRLDMDYAHCDSFDMELRVERISNPLNVYWDVTSTRFDAKDWSYAFIVDEIEEREFKRKHGKNTDAVSFNADTHPRSSSDAVESVVVAEAWYKEIKTRKLLLIRFMDGTEQVIREGVLEERVKNGLILPGSFEVAREREAEYGAVKRCVLSGADILEETEWQGSTIPVCPVWGDEVIIDGRRHFRSMVTDAMDPQRQYNYWRSAATELVALAPKAPFIAPIGSIPPAERHKWETANTRSHSILFYDASAGNMPTRQPFAGVPAGAVNQAMLNADDIKAVIGLHDASLGAQGNETSGRAILARQKEGDVSNFHFIDNMNRAIRYLGQCMVELIPHIYSTREAVRILGEDNEETIVNLNPNPGQGTILNDDGEPVLYDLTVGHYDVEVKSGPSFGTQREEAREAMMEIIRSVPGAGQYMADLLFETFDWPGADKLAERARMLVQAQIAQLMPQPAPPPQGMPPQGPGNGQMPPIPPQGIPPQAPPQMPPGGMQ